jgi:hypothetical protein
VSTPDSPRGQDWGLGSISLVIALSFLAQRKYLCLQKANDPDWMRNHRKFTDDPSDFAGVYLLSANALEWDAEIAKLVEISGSGMSFADAKGLADGFYAKLIANDVNDGNRNR